MNGTAALVLFQMSERKNFLARTAKAKLWVTLGFKQPTSRKQQQPATAQLSQRKKAKNFLNSVGKLISNSIRETTGKSGMIEKDTILLLVLSRVSILDLSGLSLNKVAQKREKKSSPTYILDAKISNTKSNTSLSIQGRICTFIY